MLRPTLPEDVMTLVEMARETGVFKPLEIDVLEEVLADYLDEPGGEGYHCYSDEQDGELRGFVCYGPNTMTDQTWDLYWIVTNKRLQGHGIGTELLGFAEDDMRKQRGRLLMIETSSLPNYEPTRAFYLKRGYEQVAVIPDFYSDGDSLVMFRKRLR